MLIPLKEYVKNVLRHVNLAFMDIYVLVALMTQILFILCFINTAVCQCVLMVFIQPITLSA